MARKSAYAHRKEGRKAPSTGKRIFRLLEFIVCISIIGGFGYQLYRFTVQSDKFLVKHVQIEGLRVLDEEYVLEQSELTEQGSVLYLDVNAVRESVEAIPYVQRCTVKQVFPDTVLLTIVERVPVLTLQLNSHSYEMDLYGVVLREYGSQEIPIMPFISNVAGVNFVDIGDAVGVPALEDAIQVWDEFSKLPMAETLTVSEISAPSVNELVMFCDELVYEIRWGNGDIAKQALRLGILWEAQEGALPCTEYLDLRFEDDLACK